MMGTFSLGSSDSVPNLPLCQYGVSDFSGKTSPQDWCQGLWNFFKVFCISVLIDSDSLILVTDESRTD